MARSILAMGLLLGTFPQAPLAAQGLIYNYDRAEEADQYDEDSTTAADMLKENKNTYGPPPPRRNCKKDPENAEIVVCAEEEADFSEFRVKSTAELDPDSREATDDGIPRAPDVAGDGIFKGKATVTGGCLLQGCPPPPAIIFDISALPEAPDGSDADLIGKGKKPAGRYSGDASASADETAP